MIRLVPNALLVTALVAGVFAAPAQAQFPTGALPDLTAAAGAIARTAPSPAPRGTYRSGLDVPRLRPGAAATGLARQLREAVEAENGPQVALAQLEASMPAIVTAAEAGLEGVGLAERDLGVVAGYAFVDLWEAARGETIPDEPSLVAARTVAAAVADTWGPSYRALAPEAQEMTYETLLASTVLLAELTDQFEAVGRADAAAPLRASAAQAFESLFGTPASEVEISIAGRISGLRATPNASVPAARPVPPSESAVRPAPAPRLEAAGRPGTRAGAGDVEVYLKYTFRYTGFASVTDFDALVLFPDGTAVAAAPDQPAEALTGEAFAEALDQDDRAEAVGTWRKEPDALVLTLGGATRRLPRLPRGYWDDPGETPDPEASYDIYFRAEPLTEAQLLGPWAHASLFTAGSFGGDAPMVASGANSARTYYADGTFSGSVDRFASATNANVGGAYGTGGSYGTYSTNADEMAGRWHLDGFGLTTEQDGARGVVLAFLMPEWSDTDVDVWMGDHYWERPDDD